MDTKKTVTIYDIAREARVSPATVSRILTGSAKVNLEKRKRVLELIQRYDFHPNNAARSLTEKRSHTLGIICPDVRNPYYASLFAECERLAYAHGYMLMLNNSFGDPNLETTFVSRMLEQRCESIIMAGGVTDWVKLPEDYQSTLQRVAAQVPLICTAPVELDHCYQITINQAGAVYQSLAHLVALGHRRIAFLYGPINCFQSVERREAFCTLIQEMGLELRREYLIEASDFSDAAGYDAMLRALSLAEPPSAVITSNDMIAVGGLRAARHLGMKLPQDMSIIGFDDSILADLAVPQLTSVHVDYAAYAKLILDTVCAVINGKDMPKLQTFDTTLSVKDSCYRI